MASDKDNSSVDRRSFLAATAAGAAVVAGAPAALATGTAAGEATSAERGMQPVHPAVKLGEPLRAGTFVGEGWTVRRVHRVEAGALRVTVAHAETDRVVLVGLCRAEPHSGAIASTGRVDLFLMNDGGDGKRKTPDDEVAMVRRLGQFVAGAEERLPGQARLLGHKARQRAYAPIDDLEWLEG